MTNKDIAGQKYGKLTALYPLEERKNRRVVWHCRCECGEERDVVITKLTGGQTKACEQCSKSRRGIDLTGRRFGRLVVIGPAADDADKLISSAKPVSGDDNFAVPVGGVGFTEVVDDADKVDDTKSRKTGKKGHGTKWLCQCDCGNTIVAYAHHLKQGRVISCGCRKHEPKDIIGERRGHLTCLRFTEKRDKQGSAIYEWRCDCGSLVERTIRGTLGDGKNPQCPECKRKVKQEQAATSRSRIVKDPDTGVALTALNNIIEGKPTAANSSGILGVCWNKTRKKWIVRGRKNGKTVYLGAYDRLEEAKAVRQAHVRSVYGESSFLKFMQIVSQRGNTQKR